MKWIKIMEKRRTPFLPHYPVVPGLIENFKYQLYVWYPDGFMDYCMTQEETLQRSIELSEKVMKNPSWVDEYNKKSINYCLKVVETSKKIHEIDLSTKSNKELFDLFDYLFDALEKIGTTIIQPRFDAQSKVTQYGKEMNINPKELSILIASFGNSMRAESEKEIIKIALKIKKEKPVKEGIDSIAEKYIKEFAWVTTDVTYGKPLDRPYFDKQIEELNMKSIKELEDQLKQIETAPEKTKEQKDEILKRLKTPPEMAALMNLLSSEMFFRQYRRDTYSQAAYYSGGIYKEIASRVGLPIPKFFYMTHLEVKDFLLQGISIKPQDIEKRTKWAATYVDNGNIQFLFGEDAKKLAEDKLGLLTEKQTDKKEILNGDIAFPGKVAGEARIVLNEEDSDKVKKGDIFIAVQATPNLINYVVDRIAGIVTEEGDLTCHAAIVAWENKIPCLVAVKKATEFFEDGEMVEIDASKDILDQGIVKKIKPND